MRATTWKSSIQRAGGAKGARAASFRSGGPSGARPAKPASAPPMPPEPPRTPRALRCKPGSSFLRSSFFSLVLMLASSGCFTDVSVFTAGRTEDTCNGAIPMCRQYAGCAIDRESYVKGQFPGDLRISAFAEVPHSTLIVRILFTDMVWPGTELLVLAYSPGCGDVRGEHLVDVDFFDLAGRDRILQFDIPLESPGDHLVEIFSDMAASYLLTADVEGR